MKFPGARRLEEITAPPVVTRQETGVPSSLIMGILNVTPDSFSDGGSWVDPQTAVNHGLAMVAEGAAIVDVGGETTRPGAERTPESEEMRRVVPVVRALADAGVAVSVDTMRASVAAACVEAGAVMINDVSGGMADSAMPQVIAQSGALYVLMHWRGHSTTMQSAELTHYDDVVAQVCSEMLAQVGVFLEAGVAAEQIVLDPGLGFSKRAEHNWALLAGLKQVCGVGYPVLLGASRKTFLGAIDCDAQGNPSAPSERDAASAATSLVGQEAGVWAVRVHDVRSTLAALRVGAAVRAAR
ncbi:Dihydropteroate synthase 1 [Dermatophilus congolensis]|uniref:Dihydropteroate synthase n=1 Tax=Dermatophilus congolensis TaxID=1863 RepID=A0A239VBY9_9MICO|nr:dihydropteroate synthase [Dermatophilus congolensis]SNV19238.1 Dihydropteroate synthase 1 [Dermatophilus congolensis]